MIYLFYGCTMRRMYTRNEKNVISLEMHDLINDLIHDYTVLYTVQSAQCRILGSNLIGKKLSIPPAKTDTAV